MHQNIEEEIENINNSHEKITKEITSYFEQEHRKLNEREEKLKYELDLKVTEIKDELEKYFRESSNILLSYERLSKAMKNYEKNKNICEIKTLCYISKINSINNETITLFKKPIKNLEISFHDNNTLNYKEYYFNGIPIPKNIKIEEEINNEVKISWDLDDLRIKDFDNKNIKYSLKIRDGILSCSNYEASELKILINECKENVEYEVNVRALIKGYSGDWSETKKFKIEPEKKVDNFYNHPFNVFGNNERQGGLFGNNNQVGGLFGNNNRRGGLFG